MMHIAIFENDVEKCDWLTEQIRQYETERDLQIKLSVFENGAFLLGDSTARYDMALVNAAISDGEGVSIAQRLREQDSFLCILLYADAAQYAISGYEVNAVSFLVYPPEYPCLAAAIDRVIQICDLRRKHTLVFQSEGEIVRLSFSDILYIRSDKHYAYPVSQRGIFRMRTSLKELEQLLPEEQFFRCDKSHIVNLSHVKQINHDSALVGKDLIPVSRLRRRDFVFAFEQYLNSVQDERG